MSHKYLKETGTTKLVLKYTTFPFQRMFCGYLSAIEQKL